jgi:hypothetical protein
MNTPTSRSTPMHGVFTAMTRSSAFDRAEPWRILSSGDMLMGSPTGGWVSALRNERFGPVSDPLLHQKTMGSRRLECQ